jgi:hypothetical protein
MPPDMRAVDCDRECPDMSPLATIRGIYEAERRTAASTPVEAPRPPAEDVPRSKK